MLQFSTSRNLFYAGIIAYRSGDYLKSQSLFEKALLVNPTDFTANFWLLRVSALQGNLETALLYLSVCKKWTTASRLENLLIPWENYCSYPTDQPPQVALLNSQTDKLLEHYQHFREFRLIDILKTIVLAYGPAIIAIILQELSIVPNDISLMMLASIVLLFSTPLMINYYYRKATLLPNIIVAFHYSISRIRRLFSSKLFIYTCLVILIGLLLFGNRSSGLDLEVTENYATILSMVVLTPICEEIIMRGVLYGYLKRYGRPLAWTVMALVSYLTHGASSSTWHIFLSLACLNVYDREKTILAPILIHSINNGIITLLVLLH
ncbi:MAG: amino terminal protease self-immunity [Firmicutes bacterium]|nr:amino terminal protease self-immunity [Bacillota bacterium]